MTVVDWILLGALALCILIGALRGFGSTITFFAKGIFGIILSIVVCYFLSGVVMSWPFVQDLLGQLYNLVGTWEDGGFFKDLLLSMHVEVVLFYIIMFIVVMIIRAIIVAILDNLNNAKGPADEEGKPKVSAIAVLNRIFGAVLFTAIMIMLTLIIFQFIKWVGGETSDNVQNYLDESKFFHLGEIYRNNPLNAIIDFIANLVAPQPEKPEAFAALAAVL